MKIKFQKCIHHVFNTKKPMVLIWESEKYHLIMKIWRFKFSIVFLRTKIYQNFMEIKK